jgi:hypothetical protein
MIISTLHGEAYNILADNKHRQPDRYDVYILVVGRGGQYHRDAARHMVLKVAGLA